MRPNLSEGIYPNNRAALSIEFCLTYRDARKKIGGTVPWKKELSPLAVNLEAEDTA